MTTLMKPPPIDLPRLKRTLGSSDLSRFVDALRKRVELGRPLTGRLTLANVSAAERQAMDDLIGRPAAPGNSLLISLDELAHTLSESGICPDLRSAVEALCGPLVDRVAVRLASQQAWDAVWAQAREALPQPLLAPWISELAATGLLRRLSGGNPKVATSLVEDLARVAKVLPVQAKPLAAFAADLFGDAHGLDPGSARATLAIRAAARIGGTPFIDDAEGRRSAWAAAGVMGDELSAPALVFNLPAAGDTPLGRKLRQACADQEPVHLSLRLLMRHPLSHDPALAGRDIYACENPTIVALAANALGERCAPLICINGQFATPSLILLRQLREAGATVRYHGDFDPAGVAIARRVMLEGGAVPWRFGAEDYNTAAKGIRFPGKPGPTPWDPALRTAMDSVKRVVHEEVVASCLLDDLVGVHQIKNAPGFPEALARKP